LGLDDLILKCVEFEYFDWIQLAQGAFQCEEIVKATMYHIPERVKRGKFRKLLHVRRSAFLSVCPSVRPSFFLSEQLNSQRMDFHEISHLNIFPKSRKNSIFIQI